MSDKISMLQIALPVGTTISRKEDLSPEANLIGYELSGVGKRISENIGVAGRSILCLFKLGLSETSDVLSGLCWPFLKGPVFFFVYSSHDKVWEFQIRRRMSETKGL